MASALYIHIPYCRAKCRYCDFVSIPLDSSVWNYLHALTREAANRSSAIHSVETLYIGGGTPTALTTEQISWLFERLRGLFKFSRQAEITFEANPCSLDSEKARALSANAVNRVSLGVQSFNDDELRLLGRQHMVGDAIRSFSLLRDAGMENINLDLICAIPNQSLADWRHSLERAIELGPEHISTYCLTIEHLTPLWRMLQEGKIERKSDEEELQFHETAREMLLQAGYEHYEISNFARPDKRSKHNMVYWLNDEYLGLGTGAFSYLEGNRTANLSDPTEYIRSIETHDNAICETDIILPKMQATETIIQQLRLREGIDCRAFERRFGFHPVEILKDSLSELLELNLIEYNGVTIRALLKGWHLANEVAIRILP